MRRTAHQPKVPRRRDTGAILARARLSAVPLAPPPIRTSLEHALLGVIAEAPGISGYDIAKIFDGSMRHFWHAHQGQIYPTLERMERAGWIKSRSVIQRRRPAKRLFRTTSAGRRALGEWLERPLDEMKLKVPPLLRTRFLGQLGAGAARIAMQEQRAAWTNYLHEFRELEQTYLSSGRYPDVNAMFACFTVRFAIAWMEASIAWCDRVIAEIESNRAIFTPGGWVSTASVAGAGSPGGATAAAGQSPRPRRTRRAQVEASSARSSGIPRESYDGRPAPRPRCSSAKP
ncbi:MAG TPA: PadR family transcriptional regulator [Candidatus Binataceae bacterium]|nr:PadR family transcriptional regulator [Candidatus Binataceae bacterium]